MVLIAAAIPVVTLLVGFGASMGNEPIVADPMIIVVVTALVTLLAIGWASIAWAYSLILANESKATTDAFIEALVSNLNTAPANDSTSLNQRLPLEEPHPVGFDLGRAPQRTRS